MGDAPDPVARAFAAAGIGAAQFSAALVAASSVTAAISVAAAIGLVISIVLWPSLVLTAAFPASFATWRVGPGALGMSIADVIAGFGLVASLPHVPWKSRTFRRLLKVMLGYSAVVSVSVIGHYSTSGAVEVVHRFVMVMGTVCIGAAVVRTGKVTAALRMTVAMGVVIAIASIIFTLSHDLEPAYAFGLQKNAAGWLLTATILVVFLGDHYLRLPRTLTMPISVVLLSGLAATQSRGAATALGAACVIYFLHQVWHRQARRMWRIVPAALLLGGLLSVAMVTSFQSEAKEHQGSDYKYGSVGSREITFNIAWNEVIKPNPVFGLGPKWFRNPNAPGGEPHNLFLDELTSDGFVGLAAFLVVLWTCLRSARVTKSRLGLLAWTVLWARIIADLFDIFWVAGPNTLPFLILGLAIGAASLEEEAELGIESPPGAEPIVAARPAPLVRPAVATGVAR